MPVFDFEGAVGGAAAGASIAGPPGAIIGGIAGGFLGGMGKDKAKKAAARRERQLRFLASPQNFLNIARQLTPGFSQLAHQTIGAAASSAAATQAARRGLTGTGLGAALATNAAAAPGIAATQAGFQQAGLIQRQQIAALSGAVIPEFASAAAPGGLPGNTQGQIARLGALVRNRERQVTPPPLGPQIGPPSGPNEPSPAPQPLPALIGEPPPVPMALRRTSSPRRTTNPFVRGA